MFKIVWDKKNNGVLLTMKSTEAVLNVPPRPVFYEELDLLGLDTKWHYPHCNEPLLWACDRRYFYCGDLVLEVKGGNIYDDPIVDIKPEANNLKLKPIDLDLLCKNNETTMFLIEHEALEFINATYRRYSLKDVRNSAKANQEIDFQKLVEKQEKTTKQKIRSNKRRL